MLNRILPHIIFENWGVIFNRYFVASEVFFISEMLIVLILLKICH